MASVEDQRSGKPAFKVALGSYPHARLLKSRLGSLPSHPFDFVEVAPITKAFAPMVREGAFDICELALVTFLQAKALRKELVLLPVAIATRAQEVSLICLADNAAIRGPADLVGKKIGVRAYSQTTGAWLRGILQDEFGITPEQINWTTFEDAHVAEYADPPEVTRARAGQELLAMLRKGELDAVIVGNDKPKDADLRDVYPDADAAGRDFKKKHGFSPVNHVIVAHREVIESEPKAVAVFLNTVKSAWTECDAENHFSAQLPLGRAALDPAISLALKYVGRQGMLARPLSIEDVWEGLPPGMQSLPVTP